MKHELITGGVGTALGVVGTVTQTNEILQTISFIVTIIGAIFSMIIVPIISWYNHAKKDGKITSDELKEGVDTLAEGVEKADKEIKKYQQQCEEADEICQIADAEKDNKEE